MALPMAQAMVHHYMPAHLRTFLATPSPLPMLQVTDIKIWTLILLESASATAHAGSQHHMQMKHHALYNVLCQNCTIQPPIRQNDCHTIELNLVLPSRYLHFCALRCLHTSAGPDTVVSVLPCWLLPHGEPLNPWHAL